MSSIAEDEEGQRAEREHWIDVMRVLETYSDFVFRDLERRQDHLNRLPKFVADKLPDTTFSKLRAISNAAKVNQIFMSEAVEYYCASFYRNAPPEEKFPGKYTAKENKGIPSHQQHRNEAILHSMYREWSKEGKAERDQCFGPIIGELRRLLPVTRSNVFKQRILVPGCGLARLPLEITSLGYACQGNEFSAFMAIPSNFLLNAAINTEEFTIHPWIDKVSNVVNIQDILQPILIPDVTSSDMLKREIEFAVDNDIETTSSTTAVSSTSMVVESAVANENPARDVVHSFDANDFPRFSMCLGDFVDIYGAPDNVSFWDGITTCFFMDTAPVVVEYIDVIYQMLKPGGVWINQGPLLYHWTTDVEGNQDPRYSQSIELSWEELRHIIVGYGFEFITERWEECVYTRCDTSMMWNTFKTVFFSVRKPQ